MRRCEHSVYWPEGQRFAHGCGFCNPRVYDGDILSDFSCCPNRDRCAMSRNDFSRTPAGIRSLPKMPFTRSLSLREVESRVGVRRLRHRLQRAARAMMNNLSFDAYQFDNKRPRPVSKETGISFEDYGRMQTMRHSGYRPTAPPWSNSDEKTQRLIAARIAGCIKDLKPGTDLASVRETEERVLALWRKSAKRCTEMVQRLKAVEKAGSLAALYAGVIYRSYRLGQDSIDGRPRDGYVSASG